MIVYGLSTCDTCRNAIKALKEAGYTLEIVDVRADGVATERLADFHAEFGDALINRRSTTWRGLSEAEREREVLDLLHDHPTLMKRPVVAHKGALTLGWTKDIQARLLAR